MYKKEVRSKKKKKKKSYDVLENSCVFSAPSFRLHFSKISARASTREEKSIKRAGLFLLRFANEKTTMAPAKKKSATTKNKKKPTPALETVCSHFSKYVKTNDGKALEKGFAALLAVLKREGEKDANAEERFFSDAKRALGVSDAMVKVRFDRLRGRVGRRRRRRRKTQAKIVFSLSFRRSSLVDAFEKFCGHLTKNVSHPLYLSISLNDDRRWKISTTKEATSRVTSTVSAKKWKKSRIL